MSSHVSQIHSFRRKRHKFELLVCGYARLQSEQFNIHIHMVLLPLINLFFDSVFWWHLKTDQLIDTENNYINQPKQNESQEQLQQPQQEKTEKIISETFKINEFVLQCSLNPNINEHNTNFIGFYWKIISFPLFDSIKQELINKNLIQPAKLQIHFALSCKQITHWNVECEAIIDITKDSDIKDITNKEIGWKWHKSDNVKQKLSELNYLLFGCEFIDISIHQNNEKFDNKTIALF